MNPFRGRRRPQNLLIISRDGLRCSITSVVGGRIDRCESRSLDQSDMEADETQTVARTLSEALQQMGVGARQAVFVLGRDSVVLRRVSIPVDNEADVHPAIQLQTETLSPFSVEETLSDWIEVGDRTDSSRTFLLGMMQRGALEQVCCTAEAAGLTVINASIGDLAVAAGCLIASGKPGIAFHLVAKDGSRRINVIASDSGRAVASQQLAMTGNNAADALRLQGLLQRLQRSLPESPAVGTIAGAEAIGPIPGELLEAASDALGTPVTVLPADADRETADRVLTSLGSARCFNFLRPRGSMQPTRQMPARLLQWAAVLLFALTGLLCWVCLLRSDREAEEARLQARLAGLESLIEHGQEVLAAASTVGDWEANSIDWREELPHLLTSYRETDGIRIVSLRLETSSRDGRPVIRVRGAARAPSDVSALTERLIRHERGYELAPPVVEPRRDDPSFSASFEIEATISRPLAAAPPVAG